MPIGGSPTEAHFLNVLAHLRKRDKNAYFATPVDSDLVKDYYDVIKNPMDFSTIENKIVCNSYESFDAFESDILLIFKNCLLYNAEDTPFAKSALVMRGWWQKFAPKVRAMYDKIVCQSASQPPAVTPVTLESPATSVVATAAEHSFPARMHNENSQVLESSCNNPQPQVQGYYKPPQQNFPAYRTLQMTRSVQENRWIPVSGVQYPSPLKNLPQRHSVPSLYSPYVPASGRHTYFNAVPPLSANFNTMPRYACPPPQTTFYPHVPIRMENMHSTLAEVLASNNSANMLQFMFATNGLDINADVLSRFSNGIFNASRLAPPPGVIAMGSRKLEDEAVAAARRVL